MQQQAFQQWLSEPLGQAFVETEATIIQSLCNTLFGYHLLVAGELAFAASLKKSPILHRVWIHPNAKPHPDISAVVARQDKLPILAEELDLVYLAHCLEYMPNPHEVLRETYRITRPEGHVVISVFSPWSLWNFYQLLRRYFKRVPWDGHFISISRLKDWLTLLGFDIVIVNRFFFRPPFNNASVLKRLVWLEKIGKWMTPFLSAGYVVIAKKPVLTLTPVMQGWKERKRILSPGLAEPAARSE